MTAFVDSNYSEKRLIHKIKAHFEKINSRSEGARLLTFLYTGGDVTPSHVASHLRKKSNFLLPRFQEGNERSILRCLLMILRKASPEEPAR